MFIYLKPATHLRDAVAVLDPYAVLFRYDDDDIALVTRDAADKMVESILAWADVLVKQQQRENED